MEPRRNRDGKTLFLVKEESLTNVEVCIQGILKLENRESDFYICDIDDIIRKYSTWQRLMPQITPHYAVKCNDHPTVLKVLAALGVGFDCASISEIDRVLAIGVHPSRIIYAHTTKLPSHLRYATQVNVDLITFDNELELYKMKKISPNVRSVIRIKYDAKIAGIILGLKFGCDPYTEAPNLLKIARDIGLNVVGVSFHVGSGCGDPSAFYAAIKAARHVFDVAHTLAFNFDLLDIGGGFPGQFTEDVMPEYAKMINMALNECFPNPTVRVISEPGSYFVTTAFTLACNVHSRKTIIDKNDNSVEYVYYINESVLCSFRDVLQLNHLQIPRPLKGAFDSQKYKSKVCGSSNTTFDRITIRDVLLPKMELEDWLYFSNMGAYTLIFRSKFNGLDSPYVCDVVSEANWALLKKTAPYLEREFQTTILNEDLEFL